MEIYSYFIVWRQAEYTSPEKYSFLDIEVPPMVNAEKIKELINAEILRKYDAKQILIKHVSKIN